MSELRNRLMRIEEIYNTIAPNGILNEFLISEVKLCMDVINKLISLKIEGYDIENDPTISKSGSSFSNITIEGSEIIRNTTPAETTIALYNNEEPVDEAINYIPNEIHDLDNNEEPVDEAINYAYNELYGLNNNDKVEEKPYDPEPEPELESMDINEVFNNTEERSNEEESTEKPKVELEPEMEVAIEKANTEIDKAKEVISNAQSTIAAMEDAIIESMPKFEVSEKESEAAKRNMEKINKLAEMSEEELIDYEFNNIGLTTKSNAYKYVRSLKEICEEDHSISINTDFGIILDRIANKFNIPSDKILKSIKALIKSADFSNAEVVPILSKIDVTPEIFVKEFLEFFQYEDSVTL